MRFSAALLVGLLVGCAADSADVPESAETNESEVSGRTRIPQLPHLPAGVDDFFDGGCVAGRVPGCTVGTFSGVNALTKAKTVYDDYFRHARPANADGFGWTDAPEVVAIVDTVRLPAPPWPSVAQAKSWSSLMATTPLFARSDTRTNVDIFRDLAAHSPELLRDGQ